MGLQEKEDHLQTDANTVDSSCATPKRRKTYRLLSLFSGAGGFDLGFEMTGRWRTVAAVDSHPVMVETLNVNRGKVFGSFPPFLEETCIVHGTLGTIDLAATVPVQPVDLVLGGPPCQSFSAVGKQDGYGDRRGNLVYVFADIIKQYKPKVFLFENVPNMKSNKWKKTFYDFVDFLGLGGAYRVKHYLLNCADYGAPTVRERIFILGVHAECPAVIDMPRPTHYDPSRLTMFSEGQPYQTVRDALVGLPEPKSEFSFPDLHFIPIHESEIVERFSRLKPGERDHIRRRNRLDGSKPAYTLFSGGELGGTRAHIHPSEHRELTPRECARLHGFPDEFTFAGNKSQIAIQISNSVPIPVGQAWGRVIADGLDAL